MSFILDALKKADATRHQTTPSALGKVRIPKPVPRRARWPWILGGAVLLAANGAAMAYIVWPRAVALIGPRDLSGRAPVAESPSTASRPRDVDVQPRPTAPPPVTPVIPRGEAAPTRPAKPDLTALPALAKPAERSPGAVPPKPEVTTPPTPAERPPAAARPEPAERPSAPPSPDARSAVAASPPGSALSMPSGPAPVSSLRPAPALAPTQPALPPPSPPAAPTPPRSASPPRAEPTVPANPPPAPASSGGDELSKLKLTVHVWADKPGERLVFINGRKYIQGDRIENKALLEEITQEGALVSYEGRRSLLRP